MEQQQQQSHGSSNEMGSNIDGKDNVCGGGGVQDGRQNGRGSTLEGTGGMSRFGTSSGTWCGEPKFFFLPTLGPKCVQPYYNGCKGGHRVVQTVPLSAIKKRAAIYWHESFLGVEKTRKTADAFIC